MMLPRLSTLFARASTLFAHSQSSSSYPELSVSKRGPAAQNRVLDLRRAQRTPGIYNVAVIQSDPVHCHST
jgi:hypothetical protein